MARREIAKKTFNFSWKDSEPDPVISLVTGVLSDDGEVLIASLKKQPLSDITTAEGTHFVRFPITQEGVWHIRYHIHGEEVVEYFISWMETSEGRVCTSRVAHEEATAVVRMVHQAKLLMADALYKVLTKK